ncbi:hypothetical protein HDK90DRAFT_185246 [Phyllosticta capitalensis]|uniref:Uncharacterized protein n=1 Tax=Phyllosticta capitalensis TaxID=121624 RepID=A0ABR1YWA0_9PEZI
MLSCDVRADEHTTSSGRAAAAVRWMVAPFKAAMHERDAVPGIRLRGWTLLQSMYRMYEEWAEIGRSGTGRLVLLFLLAHAVRRARLGADFHAPSRVQSAVRTLLHYGTCSAPNQRYDVSATSDPSVVHLSTTPSASRVPVCPSLNARPSYGPTTHPYPEKSRTKVCLVGCYLMYPLIRHCLASAWAGSSASSSLPVMLFYDKLPRVFRAHPLAQKDTKTPDP